MGVEIAPLTFMWVWRRTANLGGLHRGACDALRVLQAERSFRCGNPQRRGTGRQSRSRRHRLARTLETAAAHFPQGLQACSGWTDIFIFPGYYFMLSMHSDELHLPKSTLVMLVSARLDGRAIMKAYKEAIEHNIGFLASAMPCLSTRNGRGELWLLLMN